MTYRIYVLYEYTRLDVGKLLQFFKRVPIEIWSERCTVTWLKKNICGLFAVITYKLVYVGKIIP